MMKKICLFVCSASSVLCSLCVGCSSLIKSASAEVVGDDDVCDGVEDELDVLRVGGARHVAIDLLRRRFVLRLELGLDVSSGFSVFLRAWKIHSHHNLYERQSIFIHAKNEESLFRY